MKTLLAAASAVALAVVMNLLPASAAQY